MASRENPDDSSQKQWKQDAWSEQVMPDPGGHQPTIQLSGWLGKATEKGHLRLFLTQQLDEYVQFPEIDVVHAQPLQQAHSSLSGTTVQLMPDPGNYQPPIQLSGWLGKATEKGHLRLFLTQQLDEYVEFPEIDIVHAQPLQRADSSLSGTMVWVCANAPLQHTKMTT